MVKQYEPTGIEPKWQKKWEEVDLYRAIDFSEKEKKYVLVEFPYPSGERLHVGHGRSYSALDAYSRRLRMMNFNVLFPFGWDAFGLPAENYAIKTGINPQITTAQNIANAKKQAKQWGLSFDWSREVNTSDSKYYKWTQWIFIQMFKKGLAYKAEIPVSWCPVCQISLANEEVIGGKCERCEAPIERRTKSQWMLKITDYAQRLLDDLKLVDYLPEIRRQQEHWIGRSEGAKITFKTNHPELTITVFTTAIDTIFGTTFMVVAPELAQNYLPFLSGDEKELVSEYIKESLKKSELERQTTEKTKTGIDTGIKAVNPFNGREIPVFVADYVLANYGTGAIMAVPGHDARDYEFAVKHHLDIIPVIKPKDEFKDKAEVGEDGFWDYPQIKENPGMGILFNSDSYDGLSSKEVKKRLEEELVKKGIGQKTVNYHLRDWVFSRQRYWGEPIPMIYCEKCGWVPVKEKDLPVELPYIEKYQPTADGESPLAEVADWINVPCPQCGGGGKRETDTMPNWAGSNWYYLRYTDPDNTQQLADRKKLDYWVPVDLYNGGMEHTTLHLLYSRFVYKFLSDIGVVPGVEPYARRHSHGVVLGPDGRKMSKSRGNVVNPDDVVFAYGADTFRLYEMFMGPFEQMITWDEDGVKGCSRFLKRVWELTLTKTDDKPTAKDLMVHLHQAVRKVSQDLENLRFNTAVAAMMEFVNDWSKNSLNKKEAKLFLQILAPFAPHLAEELWAQLGEKFSIHTSSWPNYDESLVKKERLIIVVQVNGKLRDRLELENEKASDQAEIERLVKESPKVKSYLDNQKIKQVVFVPGKLINFVVYT